MYYAESEAFIERNPTLREAIELLDRGIAHAYHASGRGRVDRALLRSRSRLEPITLDDLLDGYARQGVVQVMEQWQDEAGHTHDADDDACDECGAQRADGAPGPTVVRVLRQPRLPAFDVDQQPADPDVFLSYRRAEAGTLATDLYYFLRGRGIKVFLDRGDIPAGAHPDVAYLRAASAAPNFIALISRSYFESLPCTFELAHAARAGNRLLRVNVPPTAPTPPPLVWFDQPNWVAEQGAASGLSPELGNALLEVARLPKGKDVMDVRRDACRYLLEEKSRAELMEVLARLPWMREFDFSAVANTRLIVNAIHTETSDNNLPTLCAILRPA